MKYTVQQHENSSSVWLEENLVDEIGGSNHQAKAKRKARLLNDMLNPSLEKRELNARLVALSNKAYGERVCGDNLYLAWPIKDIKREIIRLDVLGVSKTSPTHHDEPPLTRRG